jgi:hypothetical protein
LDYRIYHAVNEFAVDFKWLAHATYFFETVGVVLYALAVLLLWLATAPGEERGWKVAALAGTASAGLSLLINQVIGNLIWHRPRPYESHPQVYHLSHSQKVASPAVGARVRLTGAWVYDRWEGWNEMHPVWKAEILSGNGPPPPPPPAPPPPPPPAPKVFHLRASLTDRGLGKHGALHGHAQIGLTLKTGRICWKFSHLARLGGPTRAAIRFRQAGKPGRSVLALGRRFSRRGCLTPAASVYEPLVESPRNYYVVVASRRHPQGAVRGRLTGPKVGTYSDEG